MIRIITDSTACISKEEAEKYNIDVVSLYVLVNDKIYKDGVDLKIDEFYKLLKENLPTTSQPTPNDFVEAFSKYPNDEIICITLSNKISGTYQGAMISKDMVDNENIQVINAEHVALGLRAIVLEAVRLRDEGYSFTEIVEEIDKLKKKVAMLGAVDNMENLKRGGRISSIKFIAGSILNIKPIFEMKDGVIADSGKKVRGLKKVINEIANMIIEKDYDENYPIYIGYSNSNENAKMLYNKLIEMGVNVKEEIYSEIGAVLATHANENSIVVSFVKK